MDLKELALVDPTSHWYYVTKLAAVRRAVERFAHGPSEILDVGAGSGFFSLALAEGGPHTRVTCVDTNYEDDHVDPSRNATFLRRLPDGRARQADLVLFIDVLEHVDDDLELLRSYTSELEPGAVIVVTVPAFMSLWSAHDVYLEHFRRYRLAEVTRVVEDAGLEVLHRRYLFGTTLPVVWLIRRLRRNAPAATDMKPVSRFLNRTLTMLLNAEHRLPWNRAGGLTAMVVARTRSLD